MDEKGGVFCSRFLPVHRDFFSFLAPVVIVLALGGSDPGLWKVLKLFYCFDALLIKLNLVELSVNEEDKGSRSCEGLKNEEHRG